MPWNAKRPYGPRSIVTPMKIGIPAEGIVTPMKIGIPAEGIVIPMKIGIHALKDAE